jgi:NADH dehydrogenase FAD-containing subunit
MLPLRPLSLLRQRLDQLLDLAPPGTAASGSVTAVGGGAAGFEALLALLQRLRRLQPGRRIQGRLVTRSQALFPGLSPAARRAAHRALAQAGVAVQFDTGWSDTIDQGSDVVLWATGAQAHDWQIDPARRGALAVDADGFVRIDAQLRSVSHPQVFAVGDCASWAGRRCPRPACMRCAWGRPWAQNLRAALGAPGASIDHRPQRHFLALLATGDGRAIASRGPFGAEGAWAWRWKDRIDRRFLGAVPRAPAA